MYRSPLVAILDFLCKILRMSTKRTYQPSKRKRAKKHGFLSRLKSVAGKSLILRRRRKGRKQLAVPTHRKNG